MLCRDPFHSDSLRRDKVPEVMQLDSEMFSAGSKLGIVGQLHSSNIALKDTTSNVRDRVSGQGEVVGLELIHKVEKVDDVAHCSG